MFHTIFEVISDLHLKELSNYVKKAKEQIKKCLRDVCLIFRSKFKPDPVLTNL